ncbi:hypothetical protein V5799_027780, partial [Amblyomma americanum]
MSERPHQPKQRADGRHGPVPPAGDSSRHTSPETIMTACVLIAGAIIFGVVLATSSSTRKTTCDKPACREVLDYMDAIVDKSVKPCHDFYRHVCGRWIGNASLPDPLASSFMAEVLLNYTARRHREMVARQALAEPADSVSRYYNNCVTYLGVSRTIRDIVDKVLEVSGTKLESWLKMPSDETFFKLLQLSFLYRLNALFIVTVGAKDNKTHLAIDRWRSFKQRLPKTDKDGQGNTYLTAVLKAIGTESINDVIAAQCHTLDGSIGLNETLRHRQRSPLAPTSAAECAEFPPDKWIQGTNAQEKLKLSPDTHVLARDFKAICRDVKSVLLHKALPVRTVYPLALLAVDFLKLDFMLSTKSPQLEVEVVQRICHQDTMTTFKRLWPPALSKVLSISPDTTEAISGYFRTLKMMIEEAGFKYPKWANMKDRITALTRANEMRISTFSNGTLSKEDLENSRFQQSLKMSGSDWISNKATVLRRTKAPDDVDEDSTMAEDEEHLETAEVQLLADAATNTVIVPHMFAVPPVVFPDVSAGTYANLAMFGFHIARKVMSLLLGVRGASHWSKETTSYYAAAQNCYANNSGAFHGLLEDAEFDEAVGAAFALRVVLQ